MAGSYQKTSGVNLKKQDSTEQRWNNFSIETNNDGKKPECTKYVY